MDVTEATFESEVLERSHTVPVIVDFWAEWCGPCRQLGPLIESAVERRAPDVELAKVDIDANPRLAQAFQIMSIPAVKAFRDGAVVDEFVGLIAPEMLEGFLNRLVPSQADKLVAEGDEDSLREAVRRDPGHVGARVGLGRLLAERGEAEEAREVLEPVAHDPDAAGLLARLRLRAVDAPDVQAGLAALDRGDPETGLTHLLDAIAVADRSTKDDLRSAMIGVFRELGDQSPLTLVFRKRLARALY